MKKQHRNTLIRTVSAPPIWWVNVSKAQREAGITSRSQYIRLAVDWYIRFTKEKEAQHG